MRSSHQRLARYHVHLMYAMLVLVLNHVHIRFCLYIESTGKNHLVQPFLFLLQARKFIGEIVIEFDGLIYVLKQIVLI